MSKWLTDSVLVWDCTNAVWAEPSADLLVRQLLSMQVNQEAEMLVASNLELFKEGFAREQSEPGAGKAFMTEQEKLIRGNLSQEEMKFKGPKYQAAVKRFEQIKEKRDQELRLDAHAYMNSCGVCAGYTLMWLANAMQGTPRVKPEQRLARESQGYLMTRWALTEEFVRHAIGKAPNPATIYRKALKQMALWQTSVEEAARGIWDWESPGLGINTESKVLVPKSGAKKVWAAVSGAMKNGGGALLSITVPAMGNKEAGHAIGFYREREGGAILAFDANFGLGLYQSNADKSETMVDAMEKLRICYEINWLQPWVVYRVGVDDATPIFSEIGGR